MFLHMHAIWTNISVLLIVLSLLSSHFLILRQSSSSWNSAYLVWMLDNSLCMAWLLYFLHGLTLFLSPFLNMSFWIIEIRFSACQVWTAGVVPWTWCPVSICCAINTFIVESFEYLIKKKVLFHFTLEKLNDLDKASKVNVSMMVLVPSAPVCNIKHLLHMWSIWQYRFLYFNV